jgi:ribosomal protein L37AE/L43A
MQPASPFYDTQTVAATASDEGSPADLQHASDMNSVRIAGEALVGILHVDVQVVTAHSRVVSPSDRQVLVKVWNVEWGVDVIGYPSSIIAWTAEQDARDNLVEQHEQKHAEGKNEEEEADEEEPASDEECHRCEQTGLLLKGSKVTHGAWSCAKCEAELCEAEPTGVAFTFKLASPLNAIAEATAANGEFKSSQARVDEARHYAEDTAEALVADAAEALSAKVGTASADVKSSATGDVKFETDGASGADVEVALEVVSAEVEFESVATVVDEASAADEVKEEANAEVTINQCY